jgi:hypothetical protein
MPKYRKFYAKITESQDFLEMPDDFTRLVWTLLVFAVDREGRCIDKANHVKAKIMSMRDDVSTKRVQDALDWFVSRSMIVRYTANGRGYFYIPTWHEYQGDTRKETESILPSPELVETSARVTQELVKNKSCTDSDAYSDTNTDSDADTTTAPSAQRSEKQKKNDAMIEALAAVCKKDIKLSAPMLSKQAANLLRAGYTPEQVTQLYGESGWWWTNHWRGKDKGQIPTPSQVTDTIKEAVDFGEHTERDYENQKFTY